MSPRIDPESFAGDADAKMTFLYRKGPWYNHMSLSAVEKLLGSEKVANYKKFCVVCPQSTLPTLFLPLPITESNLTTNGWNRSEILGTWQFHTTGG